MSKIYDPISISSDLVEIITTELITADSENAGFSSVAEVFQRYIGFRLLTITAVLPRASIHERLWSSDPIRFPVGGNKKLEDGEWGRIIMEQHLPLVCNKPSELRKFFFDHSTIAELDCGAGINLPVVLRGEVIGTVNIFHRANWFTPERVSHAIALLILVYTPMLLARHQANNRNAGEPK